MTSSGAAPVMRRLVAAAGVSCQLLQQPPHTTSNDNSSSSRPATATSALHPSPPVHCESTPQTENYFTSHPGSASCPFASLASPAAFPAASALFSASASPGASASPAAAGTPSPAKDAPAASPSAPLPSPPRGFSRFALQLNAISLKFDSLRMRCGLLSAPSPSPASAPPQGGQHPHDQLLSSSSAAADGAAPAAGRNAAAAGKAGEKRRPRVVVVGSGWGAISFLKSLDLRKYDVRVISSRNYFTFTPLLPAVAAGTLPTNACVAGVRQLLLRGGVPLASFSEAKVVDIDPHTKTVLCCSPLSPSLRLLAEEQQQHHHAAPEQGGASGRPSPLSKSGPGSGGPRAAPEDATPAAAARLPPSSPASAASAGFTWRESYDYLVLAAGAEVNTFNIPGVAENAFFLKDYEDALAIRGRVLDLLEAAALPHMTEQQRRQLLHFVVVGGGPTGVEVAAEIYDFLAAEGKKYYPALAPYFKVSLIEMLPVLLPMYSPPVQQYALQHLKGKLQINVELQTQVAAVEAEAVHLVRRKCKVEAPPPLPPPPAAASTATRTGVDPTLPPGSSSGAGARSGGGKDGEGGGSSTSKDRNSEEIERERVPCGMVVWATGIRSPHVCLGLREKAAAAAGVAAARGPPVLHVDQQLRVRGAQDVFAVGDCSRLVPPQLSSFAASLWDLATTEARRNGYHLPTVGWLEQQAPRLSTYFPQLGPPLCGGFDFARHRQQALGADKEVTEEEFCQLLREIDAAYRPPAPTAQNAKQQGQYLGLVFNHFADREAKRARAPAFLPVNNGALAYLGDGAAVVDFPAAPGSPPKPWLGGLHSLLLWRCVYTSMQPTWSGVAACITGWLQAALEGRPIGRERLASLTRNREVPVARVTASPIQTAATTVPAAVAPASPQNSAATPASGNQTTSADGSSTRQS